MSIGQYIMSMFKSRYALASEYTHDIDNCRIVVEPELCDIEKGLNCC